MMTMVGINIGAGPMVRACRIAWFDTGRSNLSQIVALAAIVYGVLPAATVFGQAWTPRSFDPV